MLTCASIALVALGAFGCTTPEPPPPPTPTQAELTITAPDGIELRATHYSPGKPGPGVMLLHMCNSDRSAWADLGPLLSARGLHALALDYRGFGESGGEKGDDPQQSMVIRTEKWAGDVDAALDTLLAQTGVDGTRLGAAGGSCGVDQSVHLARRHPEVVTLALLAGTTDAEGEAYLQANPWMPLFASASLDDGDAVASTRWLLGFSSNPANTFAEYAQGGHGTEMFDVHPELEPRIAAWFEQYLVSEPVAATPGAPAAPGPSAARAAALRAEGGTAVLRQRLADPADDVELPPEGVVNLYGYELLGKGQVDEAIEAFLLNVEAHPESANTYDSLGDAYIAAGKGELAAETAEKVLALLDADPAEDTEFEALLREASHEKLRKVRGEEVEPATP